MFGYVKPDKPYLYLKDETLYNALYCGVCVSIKKTLGNLPRFTLTYDIAFLSALCHNVCGTDIKIGKKRCVAHLIKPRPIAERDEISDKLAALNVILAYYKLSDDISDENKGAVKSAFLKSGYKKAVKKFPEADKIVKERYRELVAMEKEGIKSIDMVADPFAELLKEVSDYLFCDKATDFTRKLMYAVGKWIYLIDALDDYDKDVKKNSYNVFYAEYGDNDYKTLIKNHGKDLAFIFNELFSEISENYNNIPKTYNTDLTENILLRGIPKKTAEIFSKQNKEQNGR